MSAVRSGNFATQPRGREQFVRIAQLARVKGNPHELHGCQIVCTEHLWHMADLVGPYAVLTGQRSADIETIGQDLGGHLLGELSLPCNCVVITDQRMQIAVASMEHIADCEAGILLQFSDTAEDLR